MTQCFLPCHHDKQFTQSSQHWKTREGNQILPCLQPPFFLLPIKVTGVPYSRAEMAVHFPVPFCPALSRILGSRCVPSESLYLKMFAVISIRKESNSVLFHLSKAWAFQCDEVPSATLFFFIWLYRTGMTQKMLMMITSHSSPVPSHRGPYPGHPSSGDRPHKSAACRHTRCHYGPFSQNDLHPHLQPAEASQSDYCEMTWHDNC